MVHGFAYLFRRRSWRDKCHAALADEERPGELEKNS
jgi:hypothetical protein